MEVFDVVVPIHAYANGTGGFDAQEGDGLFHTDIKVNWQGMRLWCVSSVQEPVGHSTVTCPPAFLSANNAQIVGTIPSAPSRQYDIISLRAKAPSPELAGSGAVLGGRNWAGGGQASGCAGLGRGWVLDVAVRPHPRPRPQATMWAALLPRFCAQGFMAADLRSP